MGILDNETNDPISNDNSSEKQEFNFNVPFIPFGSLYNHELTRLYSNNIQLFVDKKETLLESLSHIIKGNIIFRRTIKWKCSITKGIKKRT